MKFFNYILFLLSGCLLCNKQSEAQSISKLATDILINDPVISQGHIGISIYEPATDNYWYNYNATKYFIPASNTKIFSLYAGMKYLGDSLVGIKYEVNNKGDYFLYPAADPTFLHPDYKIQPVFSFLKNIASNKIFIYNAWQTYSFGKGWAWDDYNDEYMAERSLMPIYGNVTSFSYKRDLLQTVPYQKFEIKNSLGEKKSDNFSIKRETGRNVFEMIKSEKIFEPLNIPFIADTNILKSMLEDTLHNQDIYFTTNPIQPSYKNLKIIHSQSADSVFKPMMYRSDNFFAEQTLLMASNEYLGYVNEERMIDTLLNTYLKDIPQRPQWIDGSGLSRYNLFTPQSFVYILNKLKNEFGMERIKEIFPTGSKGTLKNYYQNQSNYIFAKTGTLSNNVALSGYLYTKKGKLVIFSILAGNYTSSATPVRKAIEKFLVSIREKY